MIGGSRAGLCPHVGHSLILYVRFLICKRSNIQRGEREEAERQGKEKSNKIVCLYFNFLLPLVVNKDVHKWGSEVNEQASKHVTLGPRRRLSSPRYVT